MRKSTIRLLVATAIAGLAGAALVAAVQGSGRQATDGGVPAGSTPPKALSVSLDKCKTSKADVITNDTTPSTTSTAFVAMPGMTKSVKTAKGCLIVTVSGWPFAAGGEVMDLTVSVDGSTAATSPSFYQMTADTGSLAQAHTATFAIGSVSGGTHTVSVLWNSVFGGTVFGHGMTMVVSHG